MAVTISKKLFKENYNPNNKNYKYIVAIIVIVGTTLGLKKNYKQYENIVASNKKLEDIKDKVKKHIR